MGFFKVLNLNLEWCLNFCSNCAICFIYVNYLLRNWIRYNSLKTTSQINYYISLTNYLRFVKVWFIPIDIYSLHWRKRAENNCRSTCSNWFWIGQSQNAPPSSSIGDELTFSARASTIAIFNSQSAALLFRNWFRSGRIMCVARRESQITTRWLLLQCIRARELNNLGTRLRTVLLLRWRE